MTIPELKSALRACASEENRYHMEKYMRNQFTFLGVKTPQRKEVMKGFLKTYDEFSLEDVKSLYLEVEREFKYTAIGLLTRYADELRHDDVPLILDLCLMDPWWDTIDGFAPNPVYSGPWPLKTQE